MTRDELLTSSAADYMNTGQLNYFNALINFQLTECLERLDTKALALSALEKVTDAMDLASIEQERQALLRILDRDRNLLSELRKALARIAHGSFGYCSELDEPIGILRLLARPTTSLCIEAKYRQEMREKHLTVS